MTETYEKLVQLKQEGKIGWLDFVLRGENSDDFNNGVKIMERNHVKMQQNSMWT